MHGEGLSARRSLKLEGKLSVITRLMFRGVGLLDLELRFGQIKAGLLELSLEIGV